MRIFFRQGLISYQNSNGAPQFLLPSSSGDYVSLNVSPTPLVITFAHGSSNYTQVFESSVIDAWKITRYVDNYLYWDIDLLTSNVSFGVTLIPPIATMTEPANPADDHHWFDVNVSKMRVWNSVTNHWSDRVRVFAGTVKNGNVNQIVQHVAGTQVGLTGEVYTGFIMLDHLLRPLRTSNGEFLTTDTPVRIRTTVGTSGVLASPPNIFIPVRAGQNIPAMSLVYFSDPDTVSLANPSHIDKAPIGIIQAAVFQSDVSMLTQSGEITYDQWDWSDSIGKPLYCSNSGEIVVSRPPGLTAYRVGVVKNKNTIVFNIDVESSAKGNALPPVVESQRIEINSDAPITVQEVINEDDERIVTIGAPTASEDSDGFMTADHVAAIANLANITTDIQSSIAGIQGSVSTLSTTTTEIQGTVGDLSRVATGLQGGVSTLNTTTAGLQTRVTNLETNLGDLTTTTEGLQGDVSAVSSTTANLQDRVTNLATTTASLQGNVTDLTGVVTTLTTMTGSLQGNVSTLTITTKELVTDLATLTTTTSDLQGSVSGLTDEVSTLTSTTAGIQDNVSALSSTVTGIQGSITGLATTVTGIQGDVSTLTTTTEGLAGDISDLTTTVAGVQGNVSTLTTTVADVQGDVSALTTTVTGVQGDVAGLVTTTEGLAGDISDLTTTVTGIQGDVADLVTTTEGLQTELDGKANRAHLNSVTEIFEFVDRTGPEDVGSGRTLTDYFDAIPTEMKPRPLTTQPLTTSIDFGSSAHHNLHYRGTVETDITITVQPDSFWTGADEYWENNFSPLDAASMPVGGSAVFGKHGGGNLVFVAGNGVVINTPETLMVNRFNGKVTLIKVGPNTWDLEGNLAPA